MTSSRRIAVLGTGLIGTSVAMAARRVGDRVRGWDPDGDVLERSSARAGYQAASDATACVADADIVFVCAPATAIGEVAARALADAPNAVVTDVGSVKGPVIEAVRSRASRDEAARFVGGHPLGGSERSGPDAASQSLVDGIVWAVCPGPDARGDAVARLEAWVTSVGSRPVRLDPERHDRLVAIVSHLPQVASTVLMELAAAEEADEPDLLLLAAGGFRDLTRLASSSPALWSDILLSNRVAVADAIDAYVARLTALRDRVREGQASAIERTFARGKAARLELAAKPHVRSGVAVLQVAVPDRPGALAELTAVLGEAAVNIEDLQIVHSPEGGRGTVHLTVSADAAEAAARSLASRRFEPARIA